MNYYNEFDEFASAWLRELIKDGLIPAGEVDTRSIIDVEPGDLKGFTQCHFFAGIGGWSYALQLAGWPEDRPVWTGSCPCQPFSQAGTQKGKSDDRHLWPIFYNLIRECQPPAIFGEQVSSAIKHGWLDDAQADMEKEGYAMAAVVLPAASVGAPHKRERLWFVANASDKGPQRDIHRPGSVASATGEERGFAFDSAHGDVDSGMADANERRPQGSGPVGRPGNSATAQDRQIDRADNASGERGTVGDTQYDGPHGLSLGRGDVETSNGSAERQNDTSESQGASRSSQSGDLCHWADSQLVYCRDDKYRPIPVEPSLFPLFSDGLSNRVGILRGAGNAIVPQVAAEVIKAFMSFDGDE